MQDSRGPGSWRAWPRPWPRPVSGRWQVSVRETQSRLVVCPKKVSGRRSPNQAVVAVARMLITRKIRGQLSNLDYLGADTTRASEALAAAEGAERLDQIRLAESSAAESYWRAWRRLRVTFAKADARPVPPHWARLSSDPRHSLVVHASPSIRSTA